jgi:hypothetical protein
MRRLSRGCVTVFFGAVAACPSTLRPQAPAESGAGIIGTWRLVEYWNRQTPQAPLTHRYGEHPCGYIIYTASGHVAVQIARGPVLGNLPPDSARDRRPTNPLEAAEMLQRYVSYFGTYEIDTARGVVVHHVEADNLRAYTRQDEERPFRLRGDTLVLGDGSTWGRALVREPAGPARRNPACGLTNR